MTLTENVNEQIKTAMKEKNEAALRALRAIKSAILLAKTEKGNAELDEDTEKKILMKLVKQRKESLDIYQAQNRADLVKGEEEELSIIQKFLPAMASEEEVRAVIKKIIEQTGAKSATEMGKVMPLAMKELSGKAEGKVISTMVKRATWLTMVLLIDNYDSFTYNIYHYTIMAGMECKVYRNEEITLSEIAEVDPEGFIISPGPGVPSDHKMTMEVINQYIEKKPFLGICLGFQAIAGYYGASLEKSPKPMHGKTTGISHSDHPMFKNIPVKFKAARYNSLQVKGIEFTPLNSTSTDDNGISMSFAHKTLPVWAVQYHPEAILTENGLELFKNWKALLN